MKHLITFIIAAMVCATAYSQTNNFYSDNSKVYWQKIYETDTDVSELLINSGRFSDIVEFNGIISARYNPTRVDLNARGLMEVPIYIRDSEITFFVRIQQKEGRYRVTVDQVVFIQALDTQLSRKGEQTALEVYATKRDGSFKNIFLNTAADILDEMLTSLFVNTNTLGDDW